VPLQPHVDLVFLDHLKSKAAVETERRIRSRDAEPDGFPLRRGLFLKLAQERTPKAGSSLRGEEGDVDHVNRTPAAVDDEASYGRTCALDHVEPRVWVMGAVVTLLRLELELEESLDLGGGPSEGRELVLPGAGVEAAEKEHVVDPGGTQLQGLGLQASP
jgi:hypothetical protein